MNPAQQVAFEEWLATRPECIRETARKFPPGTKFRIHEKTVWVMSYQEDGTVAVSETDPAVNYAEAVANRQPVCKCCAQQLDSLLIT